MCTESSDLKGACPYTVWLSGITRPSRLVTLGEHPHHGAILFVCFQIWLRSVAKILTIAFVILECGGESCHLLSPSHLDGIQV